ncbi:hypothetical protein LZ30DRAFT_161911 [Colletotrichum cereale]|nr:hypothetical protein LZ30DRAFT_161911 [Colletotrichum cereale]
MNGHRDHRPPGSPHGGAEVQDSQTTAGIKNSSQRPPDLTPDRNKTDRVGDDLTNSKHGNHLSRCGLFTSLGTWKPDRLDGALLRGINATFAYGYIPTTSTYRTYLWMVWNPREYSVNTDRVRALSAGP